MVLANWFSNLFQYHDLLVQRCRLSHIVSVKDRACINKLVQLHYLGAPLTAFPALNLVSRSSTIEFVWRQYAKLISLKCYSDLLLYRYIMSGVLVNFTFET